jgi:NAD(P)-dependent dehydrogenase (short-subunit alcohol dehydrogenase family)
MSGFDGKRVLVTGAASGIGHATVVAFSKAGARMVAADIDAQTLAEAVDQFGRDASS